MSVDSPSCGKWSAGDLLSGEDIYFVSALAADPDLKEIVAEFVENLPSRLEGIERAASGGSPEAAMRIHQLKGASGSYGFDDLYRSLCRLESAYGARDVEAVEGLMRDVRFIIERTVIARPAGAVGSAPHAV